MSTRHNWARRSEAEQALAEALRLAEAAQQGDVLFPARVLAARLAHRRGDPQGEATLRALLASEKGDAERAALHFALWQMTRDEAEASAARALYRTLYARSPDVRYRLRLEALGALNA